MPYEFDYALQGTESVDYFHILNVLLQSKGAIK